MAFPDATQPSWARYARDVIELAVRGEEAVRAAVPVEPARSHGGAFVTLRRFGRLRGCIGTLEPEATLAESVRDAAASAALHDPRFPPVTRAELADIRIEVSILSPPWPMRRLEEIELGRHGVIVCRGERRGLFLPQVATAHGLDREAFLSRCAQEKAQLSPDAWRDPATEVLLFTTSVHAES